MLALLACVLVVDTGDPPEARTCDDVLGDLQTEYVAVATCSSADECGQVLTGTSCGCTRNLVARDDADVTTYQALQAEASAASCDVGTSVCDCPEAYGFDCVEGLCAWDYAEGTWLPDCQADHGAATTLLGATIDADVLQLEVSYGGGCETHVFTLCWPDQSFAESNPVQASLELFHDDGGDLCDAAITETLTLELSPLKEAWHAAYGPGAGTIVVRVGSLTVNYVFDA